ncbi:phosphoribosylaminoimidazole carboxylase ATPase subunit [Salmonella enterica subsp. enterica serovar Thompson]|nr:phosphoribosylaminoimidazole carboxylase ATPase subunit [Salmonella enterica subsp. enterica serovar Thompson]
MKQVCVLGNGQLGRMLRQAGEPLGIAVWPVGLDAEPTAVPVQQSVITAEIERWPETALTRELARHPAFVNRDVFPIIADRLTQKQLFDKLGLATAPWQLLTSADECPASLTVWANWRLLSVALAATTVAAVASTRGRNRATAG